MRRRLLPAAAAALALTWAASAAAQGEPITDLDNECDAAGGMGQVCDRDEDCSARAFATACIQTVAGDEDSWRCQVPCTAEPAEDAEDGDEPGPDEAACGLGERCVEAPAGGVYYCSPTRFRMDLNLLDQCVAQWLGGEPFVPPRGNLCSLQANLARMLDQDRDDDFDIFDVELCIRAFIDQPICDPETDTCPAEDLVYCDADDDCGAGLYCDPQRHYCTRECGLIGAREAGFTVLERGCSGRLKSCNYSRGHCEESDPAERTCQSDAMCPGGSYCFLGRCASTCSRGLDCPDSSWFCTDNGRCRVQPAPDGDPGFVFDPANYAVLFGAGSVTLTAIENEQEAPLVVMDLTTKREVLDNPSVGFGYRLEVDYGRKQEAKCQKPTDDWTLDERDDCLIDPSEEFVTPLAPFGTVVAAGRPGVRVRLNEAAADRLTTGRYMATVDAIFDNGSRDRFVVHYEKLTPSGEYSGTMTVAFGRPETTLEGRTPLGLAFRLHIKDEQVRWNELLADNNLVLAGGEDLVDLTRGQLVHGELLANQSLPFALPGARSPADNRVPVKGIYAPRSGQLRLIGVLDLPADFCLGEDGPCGGQDGGVWVENSFARRVRRVFQLAGTYEDASRRYFGIYRERLSGLVPGSDLTLDGAFLLEQTKFDPSPLTLAEPLLPAAGPAEVTFPALAAQLTALDAEAARRCDTVPAAFAEAPAYRTYLAGDDFPVLRDLVSFEDLISEALLGLPEGRAAERNERILTLYDYLSGWIVPCDAGDEDPGVLAQGGDTACLDEDAARCGLALYRKAILKGHVPVGDLGGAAEAALPLFCSAVVPAEGCQVDAANRPSLATLYEHNRFHQELSQALKFHADRDLSDAFFTLYRHRANPFVQGAALSYKAEKLESAFATYGRLVDLFLSPDAAGVLWRWPMARFQGRGNDWLRQMQIVVRDRLEVQRQLVDLRRRLFSGTDRSDQLFAEHLAQQEYLVQVYLMALQERWQGEAFRSLGQGAEVFATLQTMLLQLHAGRNPLGMVPDRVLFENSDGEASNWRAYLERLVGEDGDGGLVGRAEEEVDAAVDNLKSALRDVDALEDRIFESRLEYEDTLAEICGPATMSDVATVCDELLARLDLGADALKPERDLLRICAEADWPDPIIWTPMPPRTPYGPACQAVVTHFVDNFKHDPNELCPLTAKNHTIMLRGKKRTCIGGEMGRLKAEQRALLVELEGVSQNLRETWNLTQNLLRRTHDAEAIELGKTAIEVSMAVIESLVETARDSLMESDDLIRTLNQGMGCGFIAGLAVGTDCPGKVIVGVSDALRLGIKTAIVAVLQQLLLHWEKITALALRPLEIEEWKSETRARVVAQRNEMAEFVDDFAAQVQSVVALELEMVTLGHDAQYAADRLDDTIGMALDHLVGRETGSVLVGNQWVARSAKTFSKIVDTTYRMVMAFSHRYNLPGDEASALENRVYQAVTLDDVTAIIDTLLEIEEAYCGREAIDCDAFNNLSLLRFSLRDELYPDLRDLADPSSGRTVTRGERFHNLITSPEHLRRRVRGNHIVSQIEIPFTVWLQVLDAGGEQRWMLDPTQCNHLLAAGDWEAVEPWFEGNVAVNVVGDNLGGGERAIRYELARGHSDQIRSCHPEPVVREIGTAPVLDFPIRHHVIGYAPQSAPGMRPTPPTFVTRSAELPACKNYPIDEDNDLVGAACWRTFARDRSLAAPDWMLIIPLRIDGAETANTWLAGEGLPEGERPRIEDIVVHLRYRSRPVQEY